MSAAHTPGPWHTAKREGGIAIEHREEKPYGWSQSEVALVYPLAMPDRKTGDANAALIAAAPELLAALEAVISDLQESICIAEDEGADEAWLAGAKARRAAASAAIAKARGA